MVTLGSLGKDRAQTHSSFHRWKQRMERSKNSNGPLIYFACPAQALGAPRYHLHVLIWEWLRRSFAARHASAVGFDHMDLRQIASARDNLYAAVQGVGYFLGQQRSVFGSTPHDRHEP